jgi:hypothetical protein
MYARMPFDKPATIRSLGTKLFTRIKDEKERSQLRAFLAQEPAPGEMDGPPDPIPAGASRAAEPPRKSAFPPGSSRSVP